MRHPSAERFGRSLLMGVMDVEGFQESYQIAVDNLRTGNRLTEGLAEAGGRFTLGYADLSRNPIVQVGDTVRLTLTDITSGQPIGKTDHIITADEIRKAYSTLHLTFDSIAPMDTRDCFRITPIPSTLRRGFHINSPTLRM